MGGAGTGGALGTGGASTGGAATGGASGTGGSATGGEAGSAGAGTGGTGNAGGAGGGLADPCANLPVDADEGPDGHCYFWDGPNTVVFSYAVALCESLDAHLVTITSQAEQDFVSSVAEFTWLGGYDGLGSIEPSQAPFMWITGEPFEYQAWGEGQPNNTLHACPDDSGGCYEHCLLKEDDHTWNDVDCGWENSYTCEWDAP